MNYKPYTKEELINELYLLQKEHNDLKTSYEKDILDYQNREVLYRTILNASPDDVTVTDLKGQIQMVSDAALPLFNIAHRDDVTGHSMMEYLAPGDRERAMLNFQNMFQGKGAEPTEYKGLRTDGSTFDIEVNGEFVRDAEGHPVNAVFVVRDITARKKVDFALMESEKKFKALFENMEEGFSLHEIITDENNHPVDFRFLDTNASYERHTGLKAADCIGRTIREIMPQADSSQIEAYGKVALTGEPIVFEYLSNTFNRHIRVRAYCPQPGQFATIFEDIADRKRTETLLQQTRDNYEIFFNTIDEFLFVLDEQGIIIHANSTVYDRLGFTKEELIGQSVLMVHPPHRRDEALKIVTAMLMGAAESCPVPIITKSGVQIPVETRVSHGFWDGKPAIFGVTKDISAVRFSEEKFSKLFHINPSACGLSDLVTQQYVEVNEVFFTLFGFTKDEVIGKTAAELGILPEKTREIILLKADSNGKISNAEADLIAKNGDVKHVILSAENIFVQDKAYRFTVVQDVTELKRVENVLRESESSLHDAQEIASMGSWYRDLITQKAYWSDNFYSILGLTANDDQPNRDIFRNRVHPEDINTLDEINDYIMKEMLPTTCELRIVQDGGTFKTLQVSLIPIVENDILVKLKGVIIDITKRKLVEAEIKRNNEELIKLNAQKDKFFSIIAHDLRSPFNIFLQYTRMMVEELPSLRLDEIQKMGLSMRKSATNLFNLLENLLEWARIQQGVIPFKQEVFSLFPIINEGIASVLEHATIKGIEITNNVAENIDVFSDRNILQTIIRNLLSNAVKFTPKGGKICLATELSGESFVEMSIKDTGIGMNPGMKERLFQLDGQVNRKGTEGEPSTGLGLIICKDFIEKQGGKLLVESETGVGSIFYFTIPCRKGNTEGIDSSDSVSDGNAEVINKPLRILITEDDVTSMMFLSIFLKKFGFEILEAKTGLEAVEICRINPDIGLVLMDINLPEFNGYEATRLIRGFNSKVVIIAQTAYGHFNEEKTAKSAGCNEYISKPINITLLIKMVRKYFPE